MNDERAEKLSINNWIKHYYEMTAWMNESMNTNEYKNIIIVKRMDT